MTNADSLQELLKAIVANPDDDDARLVYADALTSMGDPRGEFIVVQVAHAQLLRMAPSSREFLTAPPSLTTLGI